MDIILSNSQEQAVTSFRDFISAAETEMLITGFAGSGKTFLMNYLIEDLEAYDEMMAMIDKEHTPYSIYLTATTNKAARVLNDSLNANRDCKTIHNLLALTVNRDYKTGKTTLAKNPKKNVAICQKSLIVIDEASMVNTELLAFIDEIRQNKNYEVKVLYMGDSYQLPPVGELEAPVFVRSIRHADLNEIQRQAAGSQIIQFSKNIREAIDNSDYVNVPSTSRDITYYDDFRTFNAEAVKAVAANPIQDKILAWTNAQVITYNNTVRNHLGYNQLGFAKGEYLVLNSPVFSEANGQMLAKGDTSILVENCDFHIHHTGVEGYMVRDKELGSFFVPNDFRDVRAVLKPYIVKKDWLRYYRLKDSFADIRPNYAQTVHKSQGSTYRNVYVDMANIMRNKDQLTALRCLYVACTRPSDKLHIYNPGGIDATSVLASLN